MSVSDAFAFCALILSGYATFQTVRFNRRQSGLIETQKRLNDALLDKEANEKKLSRCAEMGAKIYSLGQGRLRLKVFNKGPANATNVRLDFPDGDGDELLIPSELKEKFPFEEVQKHQSIELVASIGLGSKSKYRLLITWDDSSGEDNTALVYLTV